MSLKSPVLFRKFQSKMLLKFEQARPCLNEVHSVRRGLQVPSIHKLK